MSLSIHTVSLSHSYLLSRLEDASENLEDITLTSLNRRRHIVRGHERRERAVMALDAGTLSKNSIAAYRKTSKL